MNKFEEYKVDFNPFDDVDLNHFRKIYELNLINFNNLIDKISAYNNPSPEWFTQTILSRSNYLSNIY